MELVFECKQCEPGRTRPERNVAMPVYLVMASGTSSDKHAEFAIPAVAGVHYASGSSPAIGLSLYRKSGNVANCLFKVGQRRQVRLRRRVRVRVQRVQLTRFCSRWLLAKGPWYCVADVVTVAFCSQGVASLPTDQPVKIQPPIFVEPHSDSISVCVTRWCEECDVHRLLLTASLWP